VDSGFVVLSFVVVWFCGFVVLWFCGFVVLWFCGLWFVVCSLWFAVCSLQFVVHRLKQQEDEVNTCSGCGVV
jgi:hypothetical protein